MMRAFIAVELPPDLKHELGATMERMAKGIAFTGSTMKWVPPENLHFTLKFMGEVSDAPEFPTKIREQMEKAVLQSASQPLQLVGLNCFPNPKKPRSIAVGVTRKGASPLRGIAESLNETLAEIGLPKDERPFTPHLTLGRFKYVKQIKGVQQILKSHEKLICQEFPLDAIHLLKSDLSGELPKYERIHTVKLPN